MEDERIDMERKVNLQMALRTLEGVFNNLKPVIDNLKNNLKERDETQFDNSTLDKIGDFIDAVQDNLEKVEGSFITKDKKFGEDVSRDILDSRAELGDMAESLSVLKEKGISNEDTLKELENILSRYTFVEEWFNSLRGKIERHIVDEVPDTLH